MTTTIRVRGAAVRVRATGPRSAPPLLLLHGIGRSLEDWDAQHDLLSERWRVLSVDLPGFGLSDRLPGPASLPSLAEGVLELLPEIAEPARDGGAVHVVGNSLGGAVALHMLAREPGRVATLTLVNSAGFGRQVTAALRALSLPFVGAQLMRRLDERTARRLEATIFHDRVHVTPERVALALRLAGRPEFVAYYLELARELGGLRGVREKWRRDLLSAVARHQRPVLITWGERDRILPATQLAAARAAFPDARWHLFPDTGHMPQIERPAEFAELLESFLGAHEAGARGGRP